MADGKTDQRLDSRGEAPLPLPVVVRGTGPVAVVPVSPARRFFRVARFVPLIMALLLTGAFIGLYFQPPGVRMLLSFLNLQPGGGTSTPIAIPVGTQPPRTPATAAAPRVVVGLGRLMPEGEVLTIAPPFGAGDARIATLKVAEGERVEPGQVLAVLDNERQLLAAVEAAKATLSQRDAASAQTRANVSASREEARAALARAETVA
ncbi:MAG: biotin/lipoyl-binding protein, partial [Beijerinckiaceae bacterium]